MPQCQPGPGPGRQEKPRLPHLPGLSLRPRFVWFRGSVPSTPTHSFGLSPHSRTPQEPLDGEGWDSPLCCCLSQFSLPLSNGSWERLGVTGRWGWLGNLFSPFSLLASPFLWRRGEGESEWSVALAEELVSPASPPPQSRGRGSSDSSPNPTVFAAQFGFSCRTPGQDPLNQDL